MAADKQLYAFELKGKSLLKKKKKSIEQFSKCFENDFNYTLLMILKFFFSILIDRACRRPIPELLRIFVDRIHLNLTSTRFRMNRMYDTFLQAFGWMSVNQKII